MRQDESNDQYNNTEKCRAEIEEMLGLASDYQIAIIHRMISSMIGRKE